MNPENKQDNTQNTTPNTTPASASDEIKWGNEEIQTTVDESYMYKDPNASTTTAASTPTTTPSEPPKETQTPAPAVAPVTQTTNTTVTSQTAPASPAPTVTETIKEEVPPKVEPTISESEVTPVRTETPANPVAMTNQPTTQTMPSATPATPETPPKKRSKFTMFLTVVLLAGVFVFIFFLPDISAYINIKNSGVGELPPVTPSPTPTAPTATIVPSKMVHLEDIAEAFNQDEKVVAMKENTENFVLNLVSTENTLEVNYQNQEQSINVTNVYTLEETILSTQNANPEIAQILVDIISVLQGNEKGKTNFYFEQDMSSYLLATDGIELSKNADGTLNIKIDLAGQMNLTNPTNISIESTDLDAYKTELNNPKASVSIPKGDLLLIKQENDSNFVLYLGDKGTLGNNAYQSLLNIVKFYLNDEVTSFQTGYPSIVLGESVVGKVSLKVVEDDDIMDTFNSIGTYQVLRIEITK